MYKLLLIFFSKGMLFPKRGIYKNTWTTYGISGPYVVKEVERCPLKGTHGQYRMVKANYNYDTWKFGSGGYNFPIEDEEWKYDFKNLNNWLLYFPGQYNIIFDRNFFGQKYLIMEKHMEIIKKKKNTVLALGTKLSIFWLKRMRKEKQPFVLPQRRTFLFNKKKSIHR